MDDKQQKLELLKTEHARISGEIRAIEAMGEKSLGFGISIIGVGLAYGVEKSIGSLFILIPIAFIGLLLFIMINYYNLFLLGGYIRFVEEEINRIIGSDVLLWEKIRDQKRLNPVNISLWLVLILMFAGIIMFCLNEIARVYPLAWCIVYGVVIGLLLTAVVVSFYSLSTAYTEGYRIAQSRGARGKLSGIEVFLARRRR